MHAPCTRRARAPCACHVRALRMPRTCRAYATHMPCVYGHAHTQLKAHPWTSEEHPRASHRLCSVAHYERCVFGPTAWPKIKKGQFIEDTVGQRQRKLITEQGLEAHREWGTFLLWPHAKGAAEEEAASFAMTHHLDGIGYMTVAERARLGLTVYDGEVTKVQEAGALAVAASGGELRVTAQPIEIPVRSSLAS